MSRRSPKDRDRDRDAAPGIAPAYEGAEVLTALLSRAGSRYSASEVAEAFRRAQAAGESRSAVIPGVFSGEPHFASPDEARRLYANLFGLWARVAAGGGPEEEAAPPANVVAAEEPLPELPDRGSQTGTELAPELVETVWRHLDALPPREVQRRRDRYMNVQADIVAWLDAAPIPESGAVAVQDLAFETWAMFDQAFGDRLAAVDFRELRTLEQEPAALESSQPALAAYVSEQLDVLADEDQEFTPEARAQVERALATIAGALEGAVSEPS
jgi:hypothetical protein